MSMTIGEDNHADDDDVDNNSGRGCAPKYDNCCVCMLRMLWISCLDNSLERVKIGTYGFADFLYRMVT